MFSEEAGPITKSEPLRRGWSRPRLAELFDVHITTIDRWVSRGVLPKPVCIGGRRVYFPAAAIEPLIAKLQGEARAGER